MATNPMDPTDVALVGEGNLWPIIDDTGHKSDVLAYDGSRGIFNTQAGNIAHLDDIVANRNSVTRRGRWNPT